MSSVKKLTKKTLVELANDLGISNQLSEKTDLKQDYVEKIEQFASANPGAASIISKHLQLFKATKSPSKKASTNGAEVTVVDTSSDEEVEVEKDSEDFSESGFLSFLPFSFDLKSYYAKASKKTGETYENAITSVSDFYYDTIDFTLDTSDSLRDVTSSPNFLVAATTLIEFSYLLIQFVHFTSVGEARYIPDLITDNLPSQVLSLPLLDFFDLFKYSTLAVFFVWSLISVVTPVIISYYINFTKTSKRGSYKYTLDPYIFTFSRFLLTLYTLKSGLSFKELKEEVIYKIFGGCFLDALFSFFLEGELSLRFIFGDKIIYASAISAIVALYAVLSK